MRPLTAPLPLRISILAALLCAIVGCDQDPDNQRPINVHLSDFDSGATKKGDSKKEKEKQKERDKNLNKSPDEVRNEALEQVSKNLDKQQKIAEEAIKKGPQTDKKKKDNKKDDPRTPKAFAMGNTPIIEPTFDKNDKHPKNSFPINDPNTASQKSHYSEILGPGQKSPTMAGNTLNLSAPGRGKKSSSTANDLTVLNGHGSAELGDAVTLGKAEEKQNFFERMFGKKKPEKKLLREGESGTQFEIVNDRVDKKKLGQVYGEKSDGTSTGVVKTPDSQKLHDIYNPYGKGELPSRTNFIPTPAEKQGLVTDRVASEMLRIEAQKEADRRAKKEQAGKEDGPKPLLGNNMPGRHAITDFEPAPAAKNNAPAPAPKAAGPAAKALHTPANGAAKATAAVSAFNAADNAPITAESPVNSEFNASKFAAPENASKDSVATAPVSAPANKPVTEESIAESQRQIGTLDDYRKGLATRDVVAREAAFRRAAAEKRQDAIPALADEVSRNGMLALTAARILGIIGKSSELVDRSLMTGLNTNGGGDATLREACAETLGELRVKRAVPLLIDKAKNEKNFTVRSACVAALGMIGDDSALTTLHMKLDDRGEIEFVKQSAALALARFGDPAGREHLIQSLESQSPAYQVLGLTGLAQLNDPRSPGYLISCLDSRFDEVWTTAVLLFPRIGARSALPLLRLQLTSGNDIMRVRASLALGFLGCSDGVALICRATRSGSLQERAMGCELLGRLNRTDQIPLLMSTLSDPNTQVRQTAATALCRLEAKEAVPLLAEAARGRFKSQLIQPVRLNANEPDRNQRDSRSVLSVQLGTPEDMNERMVMLACLRILRGEKDDFVLSTLPNSRDSSWPEFDRELLKQQVDLIKMYKLVDVVPSGTGGAGALIQVPGGQEILYRKGEIVAGGFKVGEISTGAPSSDPKKQLPPFVSLLRGDERIILYQGQAPEVENVRGGVK